MAAPAAAWPGPEERQRRHRQRVAGVACAASAVDDLGDHWVRDWRLLAGRRARGQEAAGAPGALNEVMQSPDRVGQHLDIVRSAHHLREVVEEALDLLLLRAPPAQAAGEPGHGAEDLRPLARVPAEPRHLLEDAAERLDHVEAEQAVSDGDIFVRRHVAEGPEELVAHLTPRRARRQRAVLGQQGLADGLGEPSLQDRQHLDRGARAQVRQHPGRLCLSRS